MRTVFVILAVLAAVSITAQTHELVKHSGEKETINYIKTEQNLLWFTYRGSSEEIKISTYAVLYLIDKASGKIQTVSPKIDSIARNYKKVIFLKDRETVGLRKVASTSVFFGRPKGASYHDATAMKKRALQQKAIQKGGCFIVITSETYDSAKVDIYSY